MNIKLINGYKFLRSKAVFQIFLLIGTLFFFGYFLENVSAEEVGCCEIDSAVVAMIFILAPRVAND